MYSVAFIYEPGEYDTEFHRLNDLLDTAAREIPGFRGAESWRSSDGGRRQATYYWQDRASLGAFATHPTHLQAKQRYARWYRGYHVVVSEVVRSYGDGAFAHFTPNERRAAP
jgi:heme-degrading monooxygenase HmoA